MAMDVHEILLSADIEGMENESQLLNLTEKLCERYHCHGKECIFLSVDGNSLKCHGTEKGTQFMSLYPEWPQSFKDFCESTYHASVDNTGKPSQNASMKMRKSRGDNPSLDDHVDVKFQADEEVTGGNTVDVGIKELSFPDLTVKSTVKQQRFTDLKPGKQSKNLKKKKSNKDPQNNVPKEISVDKTETSPFGRMVTRSRKAVASHRPEPGTTNQKRQTSNNEKRKSGKQKLTVNDGISKIKQTVSAKKVKGQKIICKQETKSSEVDVKEMHVISVEQHDEVKGDNLKREKGDNQETKQGDKPESISENEIVQTTLGKTVVYQSLQKPTRNKIAMRKQKINQASRLAKIHPDLQDLWKYLNKLNYSCKACSKDFDNNLSYYNHVRCHKDLHFCKVCDEFIPKGQDNLEAHKAEKHGSNEKPLKCLKCSKSFKSRMGLRSHFVAVHADSHLKFKCKICHDIYGSQAMLNRHELAAHQFEHSCFICLKKIDTKEELKAHMKKAHTYYFCTTCSAYFVDHFMLEEHEKAHLKPLSDTKEERHENGETYVSLLDTNSTSCSTINHSVEQSTDSSLFSNNGNNQLLTQSGNASNKSDENSSLSEQPVGIGKETAERSEVLPTSDLFSKIENFTEQSVGHDNEKPKLPSDTSNQEGSSEGLKQDSVDDLDESFTDQMEVQGKKSLKSCKFCGKKFTHATALLRHLKLHNNKSNFTCEHCGQVCKTDETFKRHIILHLPNDEKPFKCEICDKGFQTRTNLKKHMIVHNDPNHYICEHCGKGYRDPRMLKIHNRTHTGELPYECSECHKKFRSWENLDNHKVTHRPKTVICDVCGKVFSGRLRLNAHRKTHDAVGRYKCQFDGICFNAWSNLHNHYVTHHTQYAVSKGMLLHECEHCGKLMSSKERWRRHIRTHTGDKPYVCTLCGKKFAEKGNLNSHIKIHNNDKQFRCTHCPKAFIHNRSLKKHLLTHEQPTGVSKKSIAEGTSSFDNNAEKYMEYTKDQLLAISLVGGSGSSGSGTAKADVNLPEKQTFSQSQLPSTSNDFVLLLPHEPIYHQVPVQPSDHNTSLLPVKFPEEMLGATSSQEFQSVEHVTVSNQETDNQNADHVYYHNKQW